MILMKRKLRIAVIGAGPAGLVSAKYALQNCYKCDVYEQTGSLGGNWVYNENREDESGIEVQSSIYKDLVVNVPKEIMMYSDHHYPITLKESYIAHHHVLEYFQSYAERFGLNEIIMYHMRVTQVNPMEHNKWLLTVKNLKTNTETSTCYDCVFVCNGRFKDGYIPKISGQHLFNGGQIHSHTFRVIDPYKEQNVLIVGGHHSGQDIATLICKTANHVYVSSREELQVVAPDNLTQKPEVTGFTECSALFSDGSMAQIDSVIYCTGYMYTCPFLSEQCGVKVENNGIAPLYKQIVNIEHPTMFFIGLPYVGIGPTTFDLQVRFAMELLEEKFKLPSKETMLDEWEKFLEIKHKENVPKKHIHTINNKEAEIYSKDLAATANVFNLPPVFFKIFERVVSKRDRMNYRIIDDENFEETIP